MGAKSSKSKVKLLNINAVAKRQVKNGYKGPLLNQSIESQWADSELTTCDPKLAAVAFETMSSFLPPEKYLTLNKKLSCGVFVGKLFFVN